MAAVLQFKTNHATVLFKTTYLHKNLNEKNKCYVSYLDRILHYAGVCICQNAMNVQFEICIFPCIHILHEKKKLVNKY